MLKILNHIWMLLLNFSFRIRQLFYPFLLRKCWKNFVYRNNVFINSPRNINIWDNVLLNTWVIINWEWKISIWNDVLVWPYTTIWSSNHNFNNTKVQINLQWNNFKETIIEDDVWIWANCTILAWITIWKWSIIWAWSIVTKNIEFYSIAVWNPAKVIKKRL